LQQTPLLRSMEATTIGANAFDRDRVPDGFGQPPNVAIVLPTRAYVSMVKSQTNRSFNYHALTAPGYSLLDPLSFDADSFVEQALAYCREQKVDGVFGFDCFPSMLAAIIKDELKLPGASSWSVFCCCSKYYMRKELSPSLTSLTVVPNAPEKYPAVLKLGDTQFYVGTRICGSEDEWQAAWRDMEPVLNATARKEFYYKWGTKLQWPTGWSSSENVVLAHSEPFLEGPEYQAEVVVLADGTPVVADTGDIEKSGKNGVPWITLFKTPGTFTLTPKLKSWLEAVAAQLSERGFRSGAMDVEFKRLPGEEAYELVEVNSRYSYMGNYLHYGMEGEMCSRRYGDRQRRVEVRNLLNRTRLALGAEPNSLPCRDTPQAAKLAAMLYTNVKGPLSDVFDTKALAALIDEGTVDAFGPKSVYTKGEATDFDLRQYGGWAKIGCLLMTWENKEDDINLKLEKVMRQLYFDKEGAYLPVRVIDEDGPGPTGVRPGALQNASADAQCCVLC